MLDLLIFWSAVLVVAFVMAHLREALEDDPGTSEHPDLRDRRPS